MMNLEQTTDVLMYGMWIATLVISVTIPNPEVLVWTLVGLQAFALVYYFRIDKQPSIKKPCPESAKSDIFRLNNTPKQIITKEGNE